MAVVAGIDEAGYGPILGPLVVSATAFRVPDECADADLWRLLSEAVTRSGARKDGRVRVADSKQVYNRDEGPASLERHLLAFQAVMTGLPVPLSVFARTFGSASSEEFGDYPWYRCADPLVPRAHPVEDIMRRSESLHAALAKKGCAFRWARFELTDAIAFNREIAGHANKAVVLSRRVANLLAQVWEGFGKEELTVYVDKQGGRKAYDDFLAGTFPFFRIAAIAETDERSAYCVEGDGRRMSVFFEAKCDERRLPTALASMLSKYVREVFLEMFNDYWRRRVPDLKRTAGYYTDGKRFLNDIELARRKEGVPLSLMARCR